MQKCIMWTMGTWRQWSAVTCAVTQSLGCGNCRPWLYRSTSQVGVLLLMGQVIEGIGGAGWMAALQNYKPLSASVSGANSKLGLHCPSSLGHEGVPSLASIALLSQLQSGIEPNLASSTLVLSSLKGYSTLSGLHCPSSLSSKGV